MQWAKPAFVTSWMLIVIGLGYGFYRGSNVMGVDFAGGDNHAEVCLTKSAGGRGSQQRWNAGGA